MTTESKPNKPITLDERLGKPDFHGSWSDIPGIAPGGFRIFILSRELTARESEVYGARIEGVVEDIDIRGKINDLAIFKGVLGEDTSTHKGVLRFTKTYPNGDKRVFEGELDEKSGVFSGKITFPENQRTGKFTISKFPF